MGGIGNTIVGTILESPLHPVLSGSTVLVKYRGTRTGDEYVTPVQYADAHHGLVVLVGEPDTKTWWRNFTDMQTIQVLLRGDWVPMTAHALNGDEEPDAVTPLLRSYSKRFPKAVAALPGDDLDQRVRSAVVVWLRSTGDAG